jgi:hypothetical protein
VEARGAEELLLGGELTVLPEARPLLDPDDVERPDPNPPALLLRPDPAENCGAVCTATGPPFATCVFKCLRLSTEPRAMPIPAEPLLTVTREVGSTVCTGPPRPRTTVPPVPLGAIGARKDVSVVPVYRGTDVHEFQPPPCHIHPKPGTNIQLP